MRFLGDSLDCLREFPEDARHDAGYQLEKVQRGEQPEDFKPMPAIGKGVEEIRITEDDGAIASFTLRGARTPSMCCTPSRKKTQVTARRDLETARRRYAQIPGAAK